MAFFASVFVTTFSQSAVSAILAIALGLIGAFGLQAISLKAGLRFQRMSRIVEWIALLPNIVPVIVFVLAMMTYMPTVRGFFGIVVAHALMNAGLVSVVLCRVLNDRMAGVADLAWIEGAKRSVFAWRVLLPLLRSDLLSMFLFVFAFSFASFSVPLMIGGSDAATIEVLIWQKIHIEGAWLQALALALVQFGCLLALALWIGREGVATLKSAGRGHALMASWWGVPVVVTPGFFVVSVLLHRPWEGFQRLQDLPGLSEALLASAWGSLFIALCSGSLVVISFLFIAYLDPRGWLRRLLLGTVAPSAVMTGFAILFFWRETGVATYFKIAIGLALVAVPAFYRLRWDGVLVSLREQRNVAMILGASRGVTFSRVVWPQVIGPACFIAGLSALWAWGDFAVSLVIAERDVTLAMIVQSLLQSYRLELALSLVWLLLLGGAATFLIFEGAGRVLGSKSQS